MVRMELDREFRVREKGNLRMELVLVLVLDEKWKRRYRVYIERKRNGGK